MTGRVRQSGQDVDQGQTRGGRADGSGKSSVRLSNQRITLFPLTPVDTGESPLEENSPVQDRDLNVTEVDGSLQDEISDISPRQLDLSLGCDEAPR